MAWITWLGDVDNPEEAAALDAFCIWNEITFPVGVPVEVNDPYMIGKARLNRFFRLEEDACAAPQRVVVEFFEEPVVQSAFGPAMPEMWTNDEPPKRKRGRPPKVRDNVDQ